MTVKLTKNALRDEQKKLVQLQKYLPTLQLKKSLLQLEVSEIKTEIARKLAEKDIIKQKIETFSNLLKNTFEHDIHEFIEIESVIKRDENIAGIEVPFFENVEFKDKKYFLFDTPIWFDSAIEKLKEYLSKKQEIAIMETRKRLLEKELTDVSIRVNLFEKVLIPRSIEAIKKIKIFLGDQLLSAVSQAKVAKTKIEKKKQYAS